MALKLFGRSSSTDTPPGTHGSLTGGPATMVDAPQSAATPAVRRKLPLLGDKSTTEQMRMLGVIFGALVVLLIALTYLEIRTANQGTAYVSASRQLGTLSQSIARAAQTALTGRGTGFGELKDSRARFAALLDTITRGGNVDGIAVGASPTAVQPMLEEVTKAWSKMDKDVAVVSQQASLMRLGDAVVAINKNNADLLDSAEQVARAKLERGATTRDIEVANQVVMLTQRLAKNANLLAASDIVEPEVVLLLGRDSNTLNELLDQLGKTTSDADTLTKLKQLRRFAESDQRAIGSILSNVQLLTQSKRAAAAIFQESGDLLASINTLAQAYSRAFTGFTWLRLMLVLFGLATLANLAAMAWIYNSDVASRSTETLGQLKQAEADKNATQQAILRLMNEMGDLADGDLTVRATVTEDITGAIADSVNYTIEELSVLVRRINDAASRVTQASESAQRIAGELLDASERQSREIQHAGTQVQAMARSMTSVSGSALQTAQVARHSLDAARKGTDAVQDSIKGMNEIREQIQETSKRIKRLGESSQEIGEIVELISDITEQTNVLALNAAIQAATAGDAGRGFTVVAEEVQRLAERSAEATKQIAAIVKTIQTDTQDAVAAMENSTQGVVEGAKRSDAAGQALSEIGNVSVEMATLVEKISSDTQRQANVATEVSEAMREILAINESTTRGTQQSVLSISQLADLAIELKGSVSGFKV